MPAPITVIRNAAYIVEYDRSRDAHVYRRGGDVAFGEAGIVYSGPSWDGKGDTEIDGSRLMVMPGLVSIHGHSSGAAMTKGCWEELGSPRIYMSTLFEYQGLVRISPEDTATSAQVAAGELLRSGCTSVMDIYGSYDGWIDTMAETGLRSFLAPMFSSARYATSNGHSMEYEWDEAAGEAGLRDAIDVIEAARAHPSGRLDGVMSPGQVDTCTPSLLRDCVAEARRLDVPLTIHASQSVHEFREMLQRHGLSSMEFLDSCGFLTERTIVGHAIFIDDHPWIHQYPEKRDRALLAQRKCSVAHCPSVIARRGILLNTFQSYRDGGINVGIGIDAFPHNMIDEMRWGLVAAKIAGGSQHASHLAEMVHAATVGGARALGRDDLGVIEAGAQADLFTVDLDHPDMQPLYDPLYSLVFSGLERPIRDVFVAGRQVVASGEVTAFDYEGAVGRIGGIQQSGLAGLEERDWKGRVAEKAFPRVLETVA